jgi:serpin B
MRKKLLVLQGLALAALTLGLGGGCSRILSTTAPISTAGNPSASYTPIASNSTVYTPAQATCLLGTGLYNFYQGQSGNIFFSPFSIITCLAMAQEGAVGNTQVQMQNVLNLNPNTTARLSGFQSLINEINAPDKHFTLNTADNMWLQAGFPFLSNYINTVETYYDAGVTNVDFKNDPAAALQTINGAVSQETAGYIPDLFSSLPGNTKLVLTNAIYFKGSWQYQFPVTDTNQQTFNLTTSSTEPVSMMHLTFNANIGNFGNGAANVLAIPYASNEASMYVFLPPEGGMTALESQMTGNNINSWLAANAVNMTATNAYGQVALSLPKFTFKTSYDLTNTLTQMGMPLAFTIPGPTTLTGANFWNIDGTNNLYITDVVHQAYVDVSETGTTAAAATGVVIGCSNCEAVIMPPPVTPFIVDHPFIFMIVENTTNTVLFMGRVNDPAI